MTGTYTVVLDSDPSGTVTIALSSNDTTIAMVSPASLSFSTSNWEQDQTVTVTGVNDEIVNNPLRTATISHNTSGGDYYSVAVPAVSVTLNDDDTVRQEDKAAQKVDNAVLWKAWEIGSLQRRGSQIEPILSLRTSQGVKTTTLGSHIRPQPLAKALLMAGF